MILYYTNANIKPTEKGNGQNLEKEIVDDEIAKKVGCVRILETFVTAVKSNASKVRKNEKI